MGSDLKSPVSFPHLFVEALLPVLPAGRSLGIIEAMGDEHLALSGRVPQMACEAGFGQDPEPHTRIEIPNHVKLRVLSLEEMADILLRKEMFHPVIELFVGQGLQE